MAAKTNADSQKLSRTDLFSMAIGQIIGVGIMTMTGIAIGSPAGASPSPICWRACSP